MTPEQKVLPQLARLRRTGPDHGIASCPGPQHQHGDRNPSLTWRVLADGRLLLKCHAGCDIGEIVAALGLELHDLFPDRLDAPGPDRPHRERRPFNPADLLRVLAFEARLTHLAARNLLAGKRPTHADVDRLRLAADRIEEALTHVHP